MNPLLILASLCRCRHWGILTQALKKLGKVDKLTVLGPSKYAAYRVGDLKLTDLIGVKHDRQWGRMLYEKSAAGAGIDAKKYLAMYRGNPVARLLTVDEVVSEALNAFEKSGRAGASVSFHYGNVFGKPYYAVSAYTDLTHRIIGNEIDPKELKGYIRKYQGLLHNQQVVVGLWHNVDDGYTYLDVSALIKDRDIAIGLGKGIIKSRYLISPPEKRLPPEEVVYQSRMNFYHR